MAANLTFSSGRAPRLLYLAAALLARSLLLPLPLLSVAKGLPSLTPSERGPTDAVGEDGRTFFFSSSLPRSSFCFASAARARSPAGPFLGFLASGSALFPRSRCSLLAGLVQHS